MEIAERSARLALDVDDIGITSYGEYLQEFTEQLLTNVHNSYLRLWIGYMIEQGNKEAIEIMKLIIKFNLRKVKYVGVSI
jgi:hypothetical protein